MFFPDGARSTHAEEEREGGAGLCGEPHACAWQWLCAHDPLADPEWSFF